MTDHPALDCDHCPLGRAAHPASCPWHPLPRPTGHLVLLEGEVPEAAWFVRDGLLLLSATREDGEETFCALRGRGSLVGLEAVRGQRSEYAVWTATPSVLCRIGIEQLRTWMADSLAATDAMLERAIAELAQTRAEQVMQSSSALTRVADFLLAHGDEGEIELRLLARVLHMRPETLSRALAQLRRRGAISAGRQPRVPRVIDPRRLVAVREAEEKRRSR